MTETPPPPRSRTMGAGVGLIGVVGVATLLAIFFRGGGSGPGAGSGAGAGAGGGAGVQTQSLAATQPSRPMKVRIEGVNYIVGGKPFDLAGVTELASKVPPGEGPAVVVERPGTSRAKAEEDLYGAFDQKGVKFVRD